MENLFGIGCLQKSFEEVAANVNRYGNSFANELGDILIHKLAHHKSDLPTENTDPLFFIGQYQSSKGRFFIRQELKSGNKWIYTAMEENSAKNGTLEYFNI